eukprot:4078754-Prymnesium_polylepis.1
MRDVRTQARRMTPGDSTRGKGRDSDGNGTGLSVGSENDHETQGRRRRRRRRLGPVPCCGIACMLPSGVAETTGGGGG